MDSECVDIAPDRRDRVVCAANVHPPRGAVQLDLVALDGDARVNADRGQSSERRQGNKELEVGLAGQVDKSAGRADARTVIGDLVREVLLPHTVDHSMSEQRHGGVRGRHGELRRLCVHKDRVRLGRGQAEVDYGKVLALRGDTEEINPTNTAGGIRPAHHCGSQIFQRKYATLRVVRNRGVGLPADVHHAIVIAA